MAYVLWWGSCKQVSVVHIFMVLPEAMEYYVSVLYFLPSSKHFVRASRGDLGFLLASEPLPSKPYVLVCVEVSFRVIDFSFVPSLRLPT